MADNISERTIKWVTENKGKTVKYNNGLTERIGTVVGYNVRNGLIIMRTKNKNNWKNLELVETEDVLVWTRFNIDKYHYTYLNPACVIPYEY